jgi:hypothetical protein
MELFSQQAAAQAWQQRIPQPHYTEVSTLQFNQPTPVLEIHESKRIFRLNQPIYVNRFTDNGLIYFESKALSILAYGRSENEAVESFYGDFGATWDLIAQVSDNSLTPDAIEVKREFLRVVNNVVPE